MTLRAAHSAKIGKAKFELYKLTYRRIERARKAGFHVEAIALIESLICDRLESALEKQTGNEVKMSTIGRLLKSLEPFNQVSQELSLDLKNWNEMRGYVIHQFVKISDEDAVSWNARLKYAKETSAEGIRILKKVRKEIG